MSIICKNCGHQFEGNFCPMCSQSAKTHRLNHRSIWEDIRSSLLHYNEKVIYTTRQLVFHPIRTIRGYIYGERVKHFAPISYAILLAGIYGVLAHFFHLQIVEDVKDEDRIFARLGVNNLNDWLITHYAWIVLLQIPLTSIASYTLFRKEHYNFIEHLVLNCFIAGQKLLLRITTSPIIFLLNGRIAGNVLTWLIFMAELSIMAYTYYHIFDRLSVRKRIIYFILTWLFSFAITFIFVVVLMVILLAIYK